MAGKTFLRSRYYKFFVVVFVIVSVINPAFTRNEKETYFFFGFLQNSRKSYFFQFLFSFNIQLRLRKICFDSFD